ncbi:DMT family transporter [Aureibaculum luteum]|uniref:DMT family transporter n=1 Tax=Aureibaculum luteum TaxID=1548456 RepID=UPI0021D1C19A|nr:DMT family transporter [Aureibaculum luteum]
MKKAIQFMIISALAFAMLNIGVKYLGKFNVYQIVFFRALGSLFFTYPFLIKKKIPIVGNRVKLLLLRSVIGLIAMILFFSSLKLLSTGSAVSIRYIAPIFAAVFALFILKERIKPIQWLFFLTAFVGVLMLKGFDFSSFGLGYVFALLSAIFTGLVFVLIRLIGNKDHPMVVVNYFMTLAFLVSGVLCINYWITPEGWEWLMLLSLGVSGYFGQIYMTKAMQQSETRLVAPLKYIEVGFTMIAGVIWFHEGYTLLSVLGITLIVISLVLNVLVVKRS